MSRRGRLINNKRKGGKLKYFAFSLYKISKNMKHPTCKILLLFTIILSFVSVTFSQTDNSQGIELFKKGDYQSAVKSLKKSDDIKDLYYLGLSYEKINDTEKAKDAFKKSFAKSYKIFFTNFSQWYKVNREDQKQNFSALLQELSQNNQIGLLAAEKAFTLKSNIFQTNEWRIKAKILSDTLDLAKAGNPVYYSSDPSISKLKITEKQAANYPKDNRGVPIIRFNQSPNRQVIVTIFVVFAADGTIKLMLPIDDLIDAYTAESLAAASQIKFAPSIKENKAVASHAKVEYSFESR